MSSSASSSSSSSSEERKRPEDLPTAETNAKTQDANCVDLVAYLERIGISKDEPLDIPSATLLTKLHYAQITHIPFSNLNLHTSTGRGKPRPLEIAALQEGLVRNKQGGFCFELNELFAQVLLTIGFQVSRRCARVLLGGGRSVEQPSGRSHQVLLVWTTEEDGRRSRFLCDVGFGGGGLVYPLLLEGTNGPAVVNGEAKCPVTLDCLRLYWHSSLIGSVLSKRKNLEASAENVDDDAIAASSGWQDLYSFTDDAWDCPRDFVGPNFACSVDNRKGICRLRMAALTTATGRIAFSNACWDGGRRLRLAAPANVVDQHADLFKLCPPLASEDCPSSDERQFFVLDSPSVIRQVLQELLGLDVSEADIAAWE